MALVVQHNLMAANANRQLGVITNSQAKSTEKLSSGYRINRAGDDAAGLTISEKMRSQIRGLDKASTNAQDGISLIQSAEGALNEAHSILQRMNELAVQGANDTNQTIDRDAINKELAALTDELDRIATTTQFNKQNLLDGSFKDKNLQVGANSGQSITISIDSMNAEELGLGKIGINEGTTSPKKVVYDGNSYTYKASKTFSFNQNAIITSAKGKASGSITSAAFGLKWNGTSAYYEAYGEKFAKAASAKANYISQKKKEVSKALTDNMAKYITLSTTAASISSTGIKGYAARVDDFSLAGTTITKVQEAINKVSDQRSALGALQNRLEHTIANLDTVSENTSAAESRIRDTDMAKEMVTYSKNSILAQAGQSMLAQANQSTQGVLSLLQ